MTPRDEMRKIIVAADTARLSVAVHAIGDRANAELLDILSQAAKTNGARPPLPHRARPAPAAAETSSVSRAGRDRVDAAVSRHRRRPLGRGPHRRETLRIVVCLRVCSTRGALGVRLRLAGGAARSAAGHRRGGQSPHPRRQASRRLVSRTERSASRRRSRRTRWALAYAAFEDKDRGSIAVGKLADIVVLLRDILDAKEQDRIVETKVVLTVIGGKIVLKNEGKDANEHSNGDPGTSRRSPRSDVQRAVERVLGDRERLTRRQLSGWMPYSMHSAEDFQNWMDRSLAEQERGESLIFATIEPVSGEIAGSTRFMNIDRANRRVEIGSTWIVPKRQRTACSIRPPNM